VRGSVLSGAFCATLAFLAAPGPAAADSIVEPRLVESPTDLADGMMCGPECLWLVAHLYGKEVSLEKLVRMAGTDPHSGTSVEDIIRVCRQLGLPAEAVETDLDSLLWDPRRDILLVSNNSHYVLLLGADEENVFVADGRGRRAIDGGAFSNYWGGVAIAVGPECSSIDRRWLVSALIAVVLPAAAVWGARRLSGRLCAARDAD